MLSDIVCAGTRQKLRATTGGTIPTQATTIQFKTECTPIAKATRHTTVVQAAKSWILLFSENMRRV